MERAILGAGGGAMTNTELPDAPWADAPNLTSALPDAPWAATPIAASEAQPVVDQPKPEKGIVNSIGRGVAKGASLNFYDELRGLMEAGGLDHKDPASMTKLVSGAYNYWTGEPEAVKRYDTAVVRERAADKEAQTEHPNYFLAGEIGGGLALPVGAAASAATLPARMARGATTGAALGTGYGLGEGENAKERAIGAGTGVLLGGLLGGAASPIVEGALSAGRVAARPIVNTVRSALNPEGEASRRVATALDRDFRQQGPNFTREDTAAAAIANSPTAVIDAGGETTRALARSAANTSPEAREALSRLTQDRFGNQNDRAANFVRTLTGANADNPATLEALQAAARRSNTPAYERAYNAGRSVWDDTLEQISQAPAVQDAIRQATRTGANRAAADGFQPIRNPFQTDAEGVLRLRQNQDGSQATPSLQFWDHVKRNLDDQYETLNRSGERSAARDVNDLRRQLLGHLDDNVPEYQAARAGAAQAFGAQDALEAGSSFVTSKMDNAEARRAFQRMSHPERQLFQQGFASTLINHIGEMGDRRTILNSIAQSPSSRERMEIALGPQRSRQMEAFLRVEGIMDRARTAVTGNSTTARQLTELGLAGGATGIAGAGDVTNPRALATGAIVYGMIHGRNAINQNVARRVGEMLASNDPNVINRGIQMIARNNTMLNRLRSIDGFGTRVAGQQSPSQMFVPGSMAARAEDDKKQP
jgi:hypothetical protein